MRPPRADIAVPPFPPRLEWVGGPAPRLDRAVTAGPLLVHFLDLAQLNSIRALPYIAAWERRYAPQGLTVLGIHSPRFPFTRSAEAVANSLPRLEISWPVAVDSGFSTWRAYGCEGWPSLFLWGRGGALRWYHLGEGEYQATEEAVREQLGAPEAGWPPPVEPLRASDAPGARVIPPTPELIPGGSLDRPWKPGPRADALAISYEGAGAYAAVDGNGELEVTGPKRSRTVAVEGPGLYELAADELSGSRELHLRASGDIAIHSVQFAAGSRA